MTKNPFYNALSAILYIAGIVSLIFFMSTTLEGEDTPILSPILALSLLTLSVSVMAYIFFYKPLLLLLDGKREDGVRLFLQTVGIFAGATLLILITTFLVRT